MTASWSVSEHLAKPLEVLHEHETRSFSVYPRVCVQTEIVFAGENRCFLLERAWCPCYSSRACLADFASFGMPDPSCSRSHRRDVVVGRDFSLRDYPPHRESLLAGKELAGNDAAPFLLRGDPALSAGVPPNAS